MADVFTDHLVGNLGYTWSGDAGRGHVGGKLLQILSVVEDCVRRRVANGTKVFKIFPDSLIHGCCGIPAAEVLLNYRRISEMNDARFADPTKRRVLVVKASDWTGLPGGMLFPPLEGDDDSLKLLKLTGQI